MSAMILALCAVAGTGPVRDADESAARRNSGVASNQSVDLSGGAGNAAGNSSSSSRQALLDAVAHFSANLPEGQASVSAATETVPRGGAMTAVHRRSGGASGSLSKGIGALAIVLGAVALTYWAVRHWVPSVRGAEGGLLKVVGRISLTPKHHAALVLLGRRYILIGISPERVSTLCEVSDPQEVAELMSRAAAPAAKGSAVFDAQLLREVGEYGHLPGESSDQSDPATPLRKGTPGPLGDLLHKLRSMQSV